MPDEQKMASVSAFKVKPDGSRTPMSNDEMMPSVKSYTRKAYKRNNSEIFHRRPKSRASGRSGSR